MRSKILFTFLVSFGFSQEFLAQSIKRITIVNSADTVQERDMTARIQSNIKDVTKGKYRVVFSVYQGNNNQSKLAQLIKQAQKTHSDLIVTTGLSASQQLVNLKKYAKPSIAGYVVSEPLQGMPKALAGKSGKHNFTYVKQNYNTAKDLAKFDNLYPVDSFVLVVDSLFANHDALIQSAFKAATLKPFKIVYVDPYNYQSTIAQTIEPNKKQGFYISPLASFTNSQIGDFFTEMQRKKLATFSMNGDKYTKLGAMAGFSSSEYPEIRSRRIALDALKIFDGQSARSLPVNLPQVETSFVFNESVANTIGFSADFSVLASADLVSSDVSSNLITNKVYDYETALAIAIKTNLQLKKKQKELDFAQTEILEAKRAFLPSLDVSYTATKVDNDFRAVQGAGITQKLKATASQVLYSDEAISVFKARKFSVASNKEAIKQAENQLVYDVMSGFVQHLNAKNQVLLLQENLKRINTSLNIAKRKSNVGYASKIDVHRLESEQKINQANLNQARAGLTQAKLFLKKLLDLPLNADVDFVDIKQPISLLSIGNKSLLEKLNNQSKVTQFTDYLTSVAFDSRAELKQYGYQLDALKQLARAEKRKWYVPTVALTANGNKEIARHDTVPERGKPTLSPNWDISLVATLPLFDRQQKTNDQKNQIKIEQLKVEQQDLVKAIQLSIYNDVQTALASYGQISLFKASANSAQQNFDLIENLYKHGQTNIASLIDAQNNVLDSNLKVIKAEQQFFLDYLKVEKNAGFYYFRENKENKLKFINGFSEFTTKKESVE